MKLIIQTVYDNINQEWYDWYLKRLANEEVLPGSTRIADELRENGHAVFKSRHPDSPIEAKTFYTLIDDQIERQ